MMRVLTIVLKVSSSMALDVSIFCAVNNSRSCWPLRSLPSIPLTATPPGQQCSSIKESQNVLCSDLCTAAVPVKVRSIKSRIRTRNQQSKLPMIPFTRHLKLSVGALCGLALCANGAQAPQHINIKQLSTTVEDVVVP